MAKHTFYIEHTDGTEIKWSGLTFREARAMHAYTSAHQPCNVTSHGWYEESTPINMQDWSWHEAKAKEYDAC